MVLMTNSAIFIISLITLCCSFLLQSKECAAQPPPPPLKILVPLKLGYQEFVSWTGNPSNATFSGFSVEVFQRSVQLLHPPPRYELVGFGDGIHDPEYAGLVQKLVDKEADGVIADLTITDDRIEVVDFTQPYIESTLLMVVPLRYGGSGRVWDFLQPFSARLWASIVTLFVTTGLVIAIIEHENAHFHARLEWRTRLSNVFWFTSMTLFFAQREEISTRLGRILTVFWLLVVLIFTSSYTASLTSILAAQNPYPTIDSFNTLLSSNLPVGYQDGSFTHKYLETIGFRPTRLKPLVTEQDYENALTQGPTRGGVAAILDESSYLQIFLDSRCQFTTVGNQIAYFGGFGFAFQKNSWLTSQMSMAIISLEQDGELHRIRKHWLERGQCSVRNAGTQIPLENFGGLFAITAVVYSACLAWRAGKWLIEMVRRREAVNPLNMHPERQSTAEESDQRESGGGEEPPRSAATPTSSREDAEVEDVDEERGRPPEQVD